MKGLYILTNNLLTSLNTIKFGMSMRLEYRWIDYFDVFNDCKYIYYYEILDELNRNDILRLEKEIIDIYKDKRNYNFQTEYFIVNADLIHNSVIKLLNNENINYNVYDKHIFVKETYDYKPDTLRPNEYNDIFIKLKPRDYQIEIINKSKEYYKHSTKGILNLVCGAGKTLTSLWIANELSSDKIIIGVPKIELIDQWIKIIKSLDNIFSDYKIILYHLSEEEIINLLNNNEKVILITTYHSSIKIYKITKSINYNFDFQINDECHHLTSLEYNNDDKSSFIQLLKLKSKKELSLTATLKVIENDSLEIVSNENKEFFGNIIDSKGLLWGINNNVVCDYNIIILMGDDEQLNEIWNNNTDDMDENEKRMFLTAYIVLSCISDNLIHHTIIYSNTTDNSIRIIKWIKKLLKYKYFKIDDLYYSDYNSKQTIEERNNIETTFINNKYGILSCVYCLGEGKDLPILDSVVFSENMSSNIRIVQSSLRASRKNKNDLLLGENKISKIILPIFNDTNNLLDNDNPDFLRIKQVLYQMSLEDETILHKVKLIKSNDIKKFSKNIINNNISETIDVNKDLIEKITLQIINRTQIGLTYNKAKNIISPNVKSKKDYYNLCKIDIRLPIDPESFFNDNFVSWIDYLNIAPCKGMKYYTFDECKHKVNSYLKIYPNLKNNILDLDFVCDELCNIDSKFPPNDLWLDYYNIDDLKSIISIKIIKTRHML